MKLRILSVLFVLFYVSCSPRNEESNVHSVSINWMEEDILNLKSDFEKNYQKKYAVSQDFSREKLNEFYNLFSRTGFFLDSLRGELNRMDDENTENIFVIEDIFITRRLGDRIYFNIDSITKVAIPLSNTVADQKELTAQRDSLLNPYDPRKWTDNKFGLATPLAASMVLYGIQTGLFRISSTVLKE
jgi:hypothetical protein